MNKKEFIKKLGQIIRETRKNKNLSIEELAYKSKIAYSTLSSLELGKTSDLKVYNLYKLIQNLDIDSSLIFKEQKLSKDKIALIGKIAAFDDKESKAILELFKRFN